MKCFTCAKPVERQNLWYPCDCGDNRHVDEVVHILQSLCIFGCDGPAPPPRTRIWKTFNGKLPDLLYVGDVEESQSPTKWKELCRSTERSRVLKALEQYAQNPVQKMDYQK